MEPSKPNFEIKFDSYIDAIGEGSSRSRSIISYLMVATFISALALFNALTPDYNWLTSRLKTFQNASMWTHFVGEDVFPIQRKIRINDFDTLFLPNSFTIQEMREKFVGRGKLDIPNEINSLPNYVRLSFPKYCIREDSTIDFSKIDNLQFASAVKYLAGNKVAINRREMEWQITNINRAIIENSVLINIPILGISFDVNGLAIISACAFSILYFLLFYNLARERKNFTLIFKLLEKFNVDIVSLYQLLSMRQVLTIPGSIDEYIDSQAQNRVIEGSKADKIKNVFLKVLTLAPVFLPIVIWMVIFSYDTFSTPGVGKSISDRLTDLNTWASVFCGLIMFFLFLFCTYEWHSIGSVWDEQKAIIKAKLLAGIPQGTVEGNNGDGGNMLDASGGAPLNQSPT